MDIEVVEKNKIDSLKLGDVVKINKDYYLICKFYERGYIAKGFDGDTGSTGYHDTLEGLLESFARHEIEYYPREEFKLLLKRK